MSEIKAGDEVLVKGKVFQVENDNEYKIQFSHMNWSWVEKDQIHKEEKPFLITPQDVGRFARTRDRRKAWIYNFEPDSFPNNIFRYGILGADYSSACNSSGLGMSSGIEQDDDLVAWWDE